MQVSKKRQRMICDVGVNDADYTLYKTKQVNGKVQILWTCPFYRTWRNLISRVYNEKALLRDRVYVGCSVCEDWKTFSRFKAWMETQDWEGKQLDKDILIPGNKVYSPETCAFIHQSLNKFLLNTASRRGDHPEGVYWNKKSKVFRAHCANPFTGVYEYLGYADDTDEAHKLWRRRKHELACQYADLQTDPRVAKALRERFNPTEE